MIPELDEHGRRIDDRQFKVTRNALYEICAKQSSYARREKRFDTGEAAGELTDEAMSKRVLPTPHGVSIYRGQAAAASGRSAAQCPPGGSVERLPLTGMA